MSYRDGDSTGGRKGIVATIASVLMFAIAFVLGKAITHQIFKPDYGRLFEERITKDPTFGPPMIALKQDFPAEYQGLVQKIRDTGDEGGTGSQLRTASFQYMQGVKKRHVQELAQAPHDSLQRVWQSQIEVAQALQTTSTDMCARFMMSGLAEADRPNPDQMKVIATSLTAELDAMAEGRDHPAGRSATKLSDADSLAWLKVMQSMGMTPSQIQIIANNKLETAPPDERCEIVLLFAKAATQLPRAQSDRIIAYGLATSAG